MIDPVPLYALVPQVLPYALFYVVAAVFVAELVGSAAALLAKGEWVPFSAFVLAAGGTGIVFHGFSDGSPFPTVQPDGCAFSAFLASLSPLGLFEAFALAVDVVCLILMLIGWISCNSDC